MRTIRILIPIHIMPDKISNLTMQIENILEVLKSRINVHLIWFVSLPEKPISMISENQDVTILYFNDYKNAVDAIKKAKPDLIYVGANWEFISYAFSLAGKFLNIPILSFFQSDFILPQQRSQIRLLSSYVSRFFENSIPTDTSQVQKQSMKRGRFFISKYLFLIKTQRAIHISMIDMLKKFLYLAYCIISPKSHLHPNFANTLHWLEGEILLEPLIKSGFDESTLILTGNPQYDGLYKKLKTWNPLQKKDQKISVLLLTASLYEHGFWSREQRDQIITGIIYEISKFKNEISLIVKIHPSSEILSDYQSLINKIDTSIPVHQTGDIFQFIMESDIVISFTPGSSAIIYSFLAGKPIIMCNFTNLGNDILLANNVALECRELSAIVPLIQKLHSSNPISEEKINSFIRKNFYKLDGRASERIADAIMMLLEKYPKNANKSSK